MEPANKKENTKKSLPKEAEPYKWKAGQSGNPSGRPKKKPITDLYEEILGDPVEMEKIRASVVKALVKGNMAMVLQLREMTDRVEGKVTQPIDADITVNLADAIAEARKRAGR
jgi:hypothetical protein